MIFPSSQKSCPGFQNIILHIPLTSYTASWICPCSLNVAEFLMSQMLPFSLRGQVNPQAHIVNKRIKHQPELSFSISAYLPMYCPSNPEGFPKDRLQLYPFIPHTSNRNANWYRDLFEGQMIEIKSVHLYRWTISQVRNSLE